MIESKYNWQMNQIDDPQAVGKLAKEANVDETIAKLLLQRGIDSPDQATNFLKPSTASFHDPYLMHDMKKKGLPEFSRPLRTENRLPSTVITMPMELPVPRLCMKC
ncbi:hypothetical protein [Lentilactobacillus rapi]|uniref:hypothetical protein n=1 Tax=Lentilactobacillus rapi TaxID=481723 RepID=UPI000A8C03A6|nr:hypothetical protein [Lentilactobacillus rapi]